MGIGKKPARARESVELDALWPETEEAKETDWKMIFRFLSTEPPAGRGLKLDEIGRLTVAQLEFLLSSDKKTEEPNSRKAADRHGCGIFLSIMKRTGWKSDRFKTIPIDVICQHYAVDNKGNQPGRVVVVSQLAVFLKKIEARSVPPERVKIKRRFS